MSISRRGFFSLLGLLPTAGSSNKREQFELVDTVLVAGYRFYEGSKVEKQLRRGAELKLVRDPYNEYDRRAIEVLTPDSVKLGYVPRTANHLPSFLLDRGVALRARVREIRLHEEPWERLRIDILAPRLWKVQ